MDNKKEAKVNKIVKFSLIGLIVVVLITIATIVGINLSKNKSNNSNTTASASGAPLSPKYVTYDGSLHILANGAVDTNKSEEVSKDKVRFELFFDPMCPGCGLVDRSLHDTFLDNVKNGDIEMYVNPVSFLDRSSTDNYSTRAINALLTVSDNDPEHFYSFMTSLYDSKNQPKEASGYVPVSDDKLAEIANNSGVSKNATDKFKDHSYFTWIKVHSTQNIARNDLFPNQTFATPALFLGGTVDNNALKDSTQVVFNNSNTLKTDYLSTLEKVKKNQK